jgi:hypothetical protein
MTNHKTEATAYPLPDDLVLTLRRPMPMRAVTYYEALNIAKLQARKACHLLDMTAPHADLSWILALPGVRVEALPLHEIREIAGADASGLTKRLRGGGYFIGVNKNASHTHRRFTLAHEFKHLLDYPYAKMLYGRLGQGDEAQQQKQLEWIADTFAAHFLMPSTLLKQVWTTPLQDIPALAGLFTVSEQAMRIRLENEGLLDLDQRPTAMYFRRVGFLPELASVAV